jgi:hypothetical protein
VIEKTKKAIFWLTIAVSICAVLDQLQRPPRARDWHGTIFGIPYDFRSPSLDRIRRSWWNPDDPRLFTPRSFGVGWDVNLHRLFHLIQNQLQGSQERIS